MTSIIAELSCNVFFHKIFGIEIGISLQKKFPFKKEKKMYWIMFTWTEPSCLLRLPKLLSSHWEDVPLPPRGGGGSLNWLLLFPPPWKLFSRDLYRYIYIYIYFLYRYEIHFLTFLKIFTSYPSKTNLPLPINICFLASICFCIIKHDRFSDDYTLYRFSARATGRTKTYAKLRSIGIQI